MGRVRKYKKVKSVDPFSNTRKGAADTKYDQPPSIWENESKKAAKRANRNFDDEKAYERMLQHAAKKQMKVEEDKNRYAGGGGTNKIKSVEGKKDDESMKQFKNRVREETRKTLREELSKLTSTSKKNKKFLIEKKNKKRGITSTNVDEEEIEEGFSSRSDGMLRYSDLGGSDEFRTKEKVEFGDQADRPPEFQEVGALKVKAANGIEKISKPAPGKHSRGRAEGNFMADEKQDNNKKKRSIADVVDSSHGDDSAVFNGNAFFGGARMQATVGGAKASKAEMESLRVKVQEAYRQIRDKKRKF